MNTDLRNRQLEALGMAESIAMRLRDILDGKCTDGRYACEYAHLAATLHEIEDRLYSKGEYAPENIGSV
jgi:hypothetical protein